jgi:hypothetical protein
MSFFRNLWTDLVDKRLWPVALVLLLALVAVPVLLLQGGGGDDHVDVAAAPQAAGGGKDAVVAVEGTTRRVALRGSPRDPFGPSSGGSSSGETTTTSSSSEAGEETTAGSTGSGTSTTGATTATESAGGGSSGSSTTGSTPSSTGGGGSTGSTSTGATTADPVVVRFGKAGADKLHVVAPLEALPSRRDPIVVYLGAHDGKAVFLVSSDATPGGEVECKPSKEVCQKAYIGPGDTATLDVGAGDTTTQYVIKVERAGS